MSEPGTEEERTKYMKLVKCCPYITKACGAMSFPPFEKLTRVGGYLCYAYSFEENGKFYTRRVGIFDGDDVLDECDELKTNTSGFPQLIKARVDAFTKFLLEALFRTAEPTVCIIAHKDSTGECVIKNHEIRTVPMYMRVGRGVGGINQIELTYNRIYTIPHTVEGMETLTRKLKDDFEQLKGLEIGDTSVLKALKLEDASC